MSEQPDPSDLITIGAGAGLVGIHPSSIYRWLEVGRLRGWRLGGRLRISRTELLALLEPVEPRKKAAAAPAAAPATRAQGRAWAERVLREAGFKV